MSATERKLLVYGATGFTGRLVVDEARRLGLDPDPRRAQPGRARTNGRGGRRSRNCASPTRRTPTSLAPLMDGVGCVINCAGPFVRLGEPVLRAAIETVRTISTPPANSSGWRA